MLDFAPEDFINSLEQWKFALHSCLCVIVSRIDCELVSPTSAPSSELNIPPEINILSPLINERDQYTKQSFRMYRYQSDGRKGEFRMRVSLVTLTTSHKTLHREAQGINKFGC
jgi:hypothetical protein